jgi:hypothetical protein
MHTPHALLKHAKVPINFEHYANPMVHPVTGCTISSYKKLMHNPAMAEVWQQLLVKILVAWHRDATRQDRRARMPCL